MQYSLVAAEGTELGTKENIMTQRTKTHLFSFYLNWVNSILGINENK